MSAIDVIRDFITSNPFFDQDFLIVRVQDSNNNFGCVKISPIVENDERGFLFELYSCQDIKTLGDFITQSQEFSIELRFLEPYKILVVQVQRLDRLPMVIYGESPNA